jgi:4-amino-4-deoxy-L-arabinose transferase-like glycosyltransferase
MPAHGVAGVLGGALARGRLAFPVLITSLVLGYAAQSQFEVLRLGSIGGVLLYAAAIVLFLGALRLSYLGPPPAQAVSSDRSIRQLLVAHRSAVLFALCGVAWVEAIHLSVAQPTAPGAVGHSLALWLSSIALLSAAVLTREMPAFSADALRRAIVAARVEVGAVCGVTAIAAVLRVPGLQEMPYPFQGDEGSVGTAGLQVLTGQVGGVFQSGWSDQPTLSFAPTAALIWLFGPDILGARMWSAIEGIAAVPLLYLLGRRLFGRAVGLLAAALLATWHVHIHFSRVAVNNGGDAFFAVLVLWLVCRAVDTGRVPDYLWAGLAAGATWYSYVGARLVFLLAAGYLVYCTACHVARGRGALPAGVNWRGPLTFAAAALVVAGPQLLFFIGHPDVFMARMNQVGIVQSGWLAREAAALDVPQAHVVVDHIRRAFLVFISLEASGGFYNAPVPLLGRAEAIAFVLGLGYCTVSVLDRRHLLLVVWFWSVVILGGALTIDVPNAGRLMLATPAVCLIIALPITMAADGLRRIGVLSARQGFAAAGIAVAAMGLGSSDFYFRHYVPGHYFVDANTEVGHVAGQYLRGLGGGYAAYFAGAPRMFIGFPSIPYLAPQTNGYDLNEPITYESVLPLERGKSAVFLAVPERREELEIVRQRLPGGRWREFTSLSRPEPLLFAYEVPDP